MGAVFTPGLKVAEDSVVVKERRLPLEGELLVAEGAAVGPDDLVARTELPGKIYPVNVANQLGIPASRLKELMKKDVGDSVEEGELIAETAGFFGLFKSEARAIVSGTIENISPISGEVIFQASPVPVEIDAYIEGRVVGLIEGEGCVVQAAATFIQGIFGLGGEAKGAICMAVEKPSDVLDAGGVGPGMAGKIIVGGAYLTLDAVQKAVDEGVKGIITGGFDYNDIKDLLGYEVGVAITGSEDLGLSIVVTEGFGHIQMAPATFALLEKKAGMQASINGATQIRAGVIRPEVVITHAGRDTPAERWTPPEPKGIHIGDTIRGIRAPFFGRLGRVVGLPVDLVRMESETMVRVLEIEFPEGERAVIPRANVESIDR
jgi:hypothetical protein